MSPAPHSQQQPAALKPAPARQQARDDIGNGRSYSQEQIEAEMDEWFGLNTGESRLLLDELSHGAAGARLTEEAKAALRRMAKRANAGGE